MSKLLCYVGVCLLAGLPAVAHGQTTEEAKRLVFSVKGGVTHGTLTNVSERDFGQDTDGDPLGRTGVAVGGAARYALTDHLWVQGEVLYVQKGGGTEFVNPDYPESPMKHMQKLNCVEIPLLARYQVGTGGFRPYSFGGPMVAFRTEYISYFDYTDDGRRIRLGYSSRDLNGHFENTDYGVIVGGGITYRRLFVEGRYTLGAQDFFKEDPVYKNRVVTVLVGADF